jgi:hypothetical protein
MNNNSINLKNIEKYLKKDYIDQYEVIDEIFDNKYNKNLIINEEGFFTTPGSWYDKTCEGPEVTYKLNSMGFRSKNFEKLDNNKNNILFSGCSCTFGEGLPEEYMWTKMLTSNMSKIYSNISDYNIAFPGQSIFTIIKNTYAFINKYGNPKFLFICFPPITRYTGYSNKLNKYTNLYLLRNIRNKNNPNIEEEAQYTKSFKYENNILVYSLLIHMLEDFCKSKDINLFWSAWDKDDYKAYNICNFKNYIELDFSVYEQPYIENIDNLPYWNFAEDSAHPGTKWSKMISNKMFSEVLKNEKNN